MPAKSRGVRKRAAAKAKPTLSLTHPKRENLLTQAHDGGNTEEIAAREFSNDRLEVAAAAGYTFNTALRPLLLEPPERFVVTKEFVQDTVIRLIRSYDRLLLKAPL